MIEQFWWAPGICPGQTKTWALLNICLLRVNGLVLRTGSPGSMSAHLLAAPEAVIMRLSRETPRLWKCLPMLIQRGKYLNECFQLGRSRSREPR